MKIFNALGLFLFFSWGSNVVMAQKVTLSQVYVGGYSYIYSEFKDRAFDLGLDWRLCNKWAIGSYLTGDYNNVSDSIPGYSEEVDRVDYTYGLGLTGRYYLIGSTVLSKFSTYLTSSLEYSTSRTELLDKSYKGNDWDFIAGVGCRYIVYKRIGVLGEFECRDIDSGGFSPSVYLGLAIDISKK